MIYTDHYSYYSCSFGKTPSRWAPSDYNRYLEHKVAKLEAKLREGSSTHGTLPMLDDGGPSSQHTHPQESYISTLIRPEDDVVVNDPSTGTELFYGRFGSFNHLRIIRDKCSEFSNTTQCPTAGLDMIRAFDASWPADEGFRGRDLAILPPIDQARRLSSLAMDEGMICHECLDRNDFERCLTRIYRLQDYRPRDSAFLALLLAMLAVGSCCDPGNETTAYTSSPLDQRKYRG